MYSLSLFISLIDKLKHNIIFEENPNDFLNLNIPEEYRELLEIIILRAYQVTHSESLSEKRRISRVKTKNIFQKYISRAKVKNDNDVQLLSILYYLKPESIELSSFLSKVTTKNINKNDELLYLINYAKSFTKYKPFNKTPAEHYLNNKQIELNKKKYMMRISSIALNKKDNLTILIGCSTVDTVSFHPKRKYDIAVSIPGISLRHLTEENFKNILFLIQKELNLSQEIIFNSRIDLMIGFCDVSILINNEIKNYIDYLEEISYKFLRKNKMKFSIQGNFSPINKRLLNYPSVFGTIPKNYQIQIQIRELRRLVKNLANLNTRDVHSKIYNDNYWIENDLLIHKHEVHSRLDKSLLDSKCIINS